MTYVLITFNQSWQYIFVYDTINQGPKQYMPIICRKTSWFVSSPSNAIRRLVCEVLEMITSFWNQWTWRLYSNWSNPHMSPYWPRFLFFNLILKMMLEYHNFVSSWIWSNWLTPFPSRSFVRALTQVMQRTRFANTTIHTYSRSTSAPS